MTKIKVIHDMPALCTEREVRTFLERLNYMRRSIAQLTLTCEPLFKLLRKDTQWYGFDAFQEASDEIEQYLLNVLVLLRPVNSS